MTRKLISFDWAIKKILRSKANFDILEGFLSELLFDEITILEVLESESNKEDENDKFNRIDIKVKDSNERIILIEIQYSRELDYLQRLLFASSKAISEHLREGSAYADVCKVISISILYFKFGQGNDYIYHGKTRFIGLHNRTELELSEEQKQLYEVTTVADIYPEYYLIEVKNFDDVAKNTLDEWIYFLKNSAIKENFTAKGLKQAQEKLNVLEMTEDERLAYEAYQKELHHQASLYQSTYVLGKLEGKEEGVEIGLKKGLLLTAKNMKQAGMETDVIVQITGLTPDEINHIDTQKTQN